MLPLCHVRVVRDDSANAGASAGLHFRDAQASCQQKCRTLDLASLDLVIFLTYLFVGKNRRSSDPLILIRQ